jgi:hypothetical protein
MSTCRRMATHSHSCERTSARTRARARHNHSAQYAYISTQIVDTFCISASFIRSEPLACLHHANASMHLRSALFVPFDTVSLTRT